MRKVHVTFECLENVLGPMLLDITERPNTRIIQMKAISERPPTENKPAKNKTGLSTREVIEDLAMKKKGKGFTISEAKAALENHGFSKSTVYPLITDMKKAGIIGDGIDNNYISLMGK